MDEVDEICCQLCIESASSCANSVYQCYSCYALIRTVSFLRFVLPYLSNFRRFGFANSNLSEENKCIAMWTLEFRWHRSHTERNKENPWDRHKENETNTDWHTWRENWKEVTADDCGGISNIWSSCKFLLAQIFWGKAGQRLDTTRWSANGVLTSHNWVSQSSWWGPSSKARKPHQRRILFDPSSGRSAVFFGLAQQHNAAMVIFWRCAIHGFVDMHMIGDL